MKVVAPSFLRTIILLQYLNGDIVCSLKKIYFKELDLLPAEYLLFTIIEKNKISI